MLSPDQVWDAQHVEDVVNFTDRVNEKMTEYVLPWITVREANDYMKLNYTVSMAVNDVYEAFEELA